jgi:dTDP-4-dehydrorhamnose reductase
LDKNKKKLVITGASGLLGSKIVELGIVGFDVIPIYNTKLLHSNSLKLDITDTAEVSALINRIKPTVVVHTAAQTNVDKCEREKEQAWTTNVEGTRNIAEATQKLHAKLIFISTDYVFDGERGLYIERDKPNPVNHYGLTKLESENQVSNYCDNYAILRTSVLYGWHPWKRNFANWVIDKLRLRKEIAVVEDQYNTPTLADNLAEIVIEIIEKDLQGVYHSSGKERANRYVFAQQIAKTFGLKSDLIKPVKMNQMADWTAKRPKDSSLKTNKIQKQLKTKPLNIFDGLNKMREEAKL